MNIYIGTSGFYYDSWKNIFYPPYLNKSQWLEYYAKEFNTVEINSTFYNLPQIKTVERWSKIVNNGFIFCFKASKYITHTRHLSFRPETVEKFFLPIETVFNHNYSQALVLFQIPQSLSIETENLHKLLTILPRNYKYAFEFRHISWFTEEIYSLLRNYNAALVLSDSPKTENNYLWPRVDVDTSDFMYIRFHGPRKLYGSSYTRKELDAYGKLILEKVKRGKDVYAYFNNDIDGYAVANAQMLKNVINITKK